MGKPRKKFRQRHLAGQYMPSATSTGGWMGFGSQVLDGKPLFVPTWDVPRMLVDPQVQFGLRILTSQFAKATWKVKCDNQEAGQFIDATLKKFQSDLLPLSAENYFAWGYGPMLPTYRTEDDGTVRLTGGRVVQPFDCTPYVYNSGELAGHFAGFQLSGLQQGGNQIVECPYAFWFGGFERRGGRLYDHSILRWAFDPWLKKATRGGIEDNKAKFERKFGVPTTVVYYPPGNLDPMDPNSPRNKDIAMEIGDRIESGAIAVLPDTRTPDDKAEPKWRVEVLDTPKSNYDFNEAIDFQDKLILKAMGIPPEVVEASETGSGYSGRAIPNDMFQGWLDQLIGLYLKAADHCIVRHLVDHNFGPDVKYEIEPIPLKESQAQQEQQQQGGDPMAAMLGGGGGPDGGPGGGVPIGTDPAPGGPAGGADDGGGGDPTAGGLVPYLGKRGGRGKKNPRTGEVYYNLSHDGVRYGCLLAPVTGGLRDAMVSFAKSIDPADLADDGIEDSPHLTLRYGLHTADAVAVLDAVKGLGLLAVEPDGFGVFEGRGHDVLYVAVRNADCPKRWHDALDRFPNTRTHDDYVPHLTLAYLKKGLGEKYVGMPFAGESCCLGGVEYHGPDGGIGKAVVWPSADEMAAMLGGEKVELGWVPQPSRSKKWPIKAVGTGEHEGQTKYAKDAERVLGQLGGKKSTQTGTPTPPEPKPKPAPKPTGRVQPLTPPKPAGTTQTQVPDKANPESDAHQSAASKRLNDAINNNPDLTSEQKSRYSAAVRRVASVLPPAAQKHISEGMYRTKFYATGDDIVRALANDSDVTDSVRDYFKGRLKDVENGQPFRGGIFIPESNDLHLNGQSDAISGRYGTGDGELAGEDHVYAHELAHLLDYKSGRDNNPLSGEPEWQDAFYSEINKKGRGGWNLTDYATMNPAEGFAEFGRLLYSGHYDLDRVERDFPKSSAVYRRAGLWPTGGGKADPSSFPEAFSGENKRFSDGTHTDELLNRENHASTTPPSRNHQRETHPKPQPAPKPIPVAQPVKPQRRDDPPAPEIPPKPRYTDDQRAKHEGWAADKIASMAGDISKRLGKPVDKAGLQQFQAKARDAIRQAMDSGKSEVRVPVTVGGKTLYVVVRRKKAVNMSHLSAPADVWELAVA